ncbi:MAG: class I SAM-dependent methyltransferase [Bacteroidales bacterium]
MTNAKLVTTGNSTHDYYKSINKTYNKLFSKLLMLHYPFFKEPDESLEKRQINLTQYCISKLETLKDKNVLDVGCGNGTQSLFINNNYLPAKVVGVDINKNNIHLAKALNEDHQETEFMVDDAQKLKKVPDNSVDILLCIESAFHYPDKSEFMKQIHRVLKPYGKFLIADILTSSYKNRYFMQKWKRKMNYYHWTKEDYINAFQTNNLDVKYTENITEPVIKGYQGFNNWIKRKDVNSVFEFLWFRLFLYIQVKINIILLKRRREYIIFIGNVQNKENN